ncbi:Hypothetical predicted protein [Octopus vulgaris]|uniref:Uncharacterized protein n=1 Tax=Octopus vulgaris TaxID=6645 RepID=A0AA36AN95_OCTVU|nr:Hypothetical predicted protein [Octopus vulgaris]
MSESDVVNANVVRHCNLVCEISRQRDNVEELKTKDGGKYYKQLNIKDQRVVGLNVTYDILQLTVVRDERIRNCCNKHYQKRTYVKSITVDMVVAVSAIVDLITVVIIVVVGVVKSNTGICGLVLAFGILIVLVDLGIGGGGGGDGGAIASNLSF